MFFFFNDTATTEIYTLSLHDALPILAFTATDEALARAYFTALNTALATGISPNIPVGNLILLQDAQVTSEGGLNRSEEHTSELQSRQYIVCRLLLEKKKKYLS